MATALTTSAIILEMNTETINDGKELVASLTLYAPMIEGGYAAAIDENFVEARLSPDNKDERSIRYKWIAPAADPLLGAPLFHHIPEHKYGFANTIPSRQSFFFCTRPIP